MLSDKQKDPMGAAIADYHSTGGKTTHRLRVFSEMFDEDEIPLATLFRQHNEMPLLEQQALQLANGRILDVGAGAGCHSLVLQNHGKDVTAIDISSLSVETMQKRGVRSAFAMDFWEMPAFIAKERNGEKFDTILMLMNGIGIIGQVERIPKFLHLINNILSDDGQVLLDSTDICYVFETEDGITELPDTPGYYGELTYQMQYKDVKGEEFPWLYIDFDLLAQTVAEHGFKAELIARGENYDFLARITRSTTNQPTSDIRLE